MKQKTKRYLLVCGLLLITLLGSAKNPIRVACVGNSVTFGYGLDNRETHCYPYVLQQLLGIQAQHSSLRDIAPIFSSQNIRKP